MAESSSVPLGYGEKLVIFLLCAYFVNSLFGSFWLFLFIASGISFQIYLLHQNNRYWKDLGIPGPPPTLLLGNIYAEFVNPGVHIADVEWKKMYGKIFGTFMFTQPDLVVADLDLMKQMLVKDFNNFTNRREMTFFSENKNTLAGNMMTVIKDEEWKNVRNTITPAFTGGKLRNMDHLIDDCLQTFVDILATFAKTGEDLDIKEKISACTMEVIAATAFGMKIDSQRNPNDPFLQHSKLVTRLPVGLLIIVLFPKVNHYLLEYFGINIFNASVEDFFRKNLTKIIEERRKHPLTDKPDFLQLVLNAASGKEDKNEEKDDAISHNVGGNRVPLTEAQILSQSFLFLVAGYETTAVTLSFIFYQLAWFQDVQEKCYEEIASVSADQPFTYNDVQHKMPYLEQVIAETLRLYPPAVRFDRTCKEDYSYNGVQVPKGATVSFPTYLIHHDEEYFPDPEKFIPERFSAEEKDKRNPFTYLPFGYGPRNCIGMRFAQMEMKMILANAIRKFRFVPCDKTEKFPMKLSVQNLLKPAKTIYIKVEKRN